MSWRYTEQDTSCPGVSLTIKTEMGKLEQLDRVR